jgi:hypothetical protein
VFYSECIALAIVNFLYLNVRQERELMEQLASDYKPEQDLSLLREALAEQIKNKKSKQEQFIAENDVFHDAKNISIEYAVASGGTFPEYENLLALYYNGYLDYLPDEILRASECENVEEFHDLIHPWYEDEVEEEEKLTKDLLDEAYSKLAAGTIPPDIFKKVRYKHRKIGYITDEIVSDTEKLKRYTRWEVIDRFRIYDSNGTPDMSDDSVLEMLLGIRLKSGYSCSGYPHRLIENRSGKVSLADIEHKAEELGYLDYAYPDLRKKTRIKILEAGKPIIPLDSDLRPLFSSSINEVYLNTKSRELLIGRSAIELVRAKNGRRIPFVKPFHEAIHEIDGPVYAQRSRRLDLRDLNQQDCVDAGRFFVRQTGKKPTTVDMKLGRFPYSDNTIYRQFGSLPEFHVALEESSDSTDEIAA